MAKTCGKTTGSKGKTNSKKAMSNSVEHEVAKVNKSVAEAIAIEAQCKSVQKGMKRGKNEVESDDQRGHKRHRKSATCTSSKNSVNGNENLVHVTFPDGDQEFEMRVNVEDESFYESNDEEADGEVSFHYSGDGQTTEGEDSKEGRSTSEDENYGDTVAEFSKPKSRKEKIKELDREMKQKLQELRNLMSEEGLQESVEMLDAMFEVEQDRPQVRQTSGKNLNANSNVKSNKLSTQKLKYNRRASCDRYPRDTNVKSVPSEDTIYERAVNKRGSSSSEDANQQDLSDESLDVGLNNLNVTLNEIVGDPVHKYDRHDKSSEPQPSTSRGRLSESDRDRTYDRRSTHERTPESTPEEKADQIVREAELARAQVFPVSGKQHGTYDKFGAPGVSAARIDKTYITVGGHID